MTIDDAVATLMLKRVVLPLSSARFVAATVQHLNNGNTHGAGRARAEERRSTLRELRRMKS